MLFAAPAPVCVLDQQSEQWRGLDLPSRRAGYQIASAASAVCQYKALSDARPWVKVYFLCHCGCLCRELFAVPSGVGSGLWFCLTKCSSSLPSEVDLKTCCLHMVSHLSSFVAPVSAVSSQWNQDLFIPVVTSHRTPLLKERSLNNGCIVNHVFASRQRTRTHVDCLAFFFWKHLEADSYYEQICYLCGDYDGSMSKTCMFDYAHCCCCSFCYFSKLIDQTCH